MTLDKWRGWNVLLTDVVGMPILRLDPSGNVVESSGKVVSHYPIVSPSDSDGLARSVADWINWVTDEPGEFRAADIHPQLRDRVIALMPDAVQA